jgi:superfamily II DNA/RNA helicase
MHGQKSASFFYPSCNFFQLTVIYYSQRLTGHLRSLLPKKSAAKNPLDISRILIFALYKKEASRVEDTLRRQGYTVGALHGDMSQDARMKALDAFKTGTTQLLVATDVAARGLDIPNVGAVINYTFPLTIEDYIHRIGRTGESSQIFCVSVFRTQCYDRPWRQDWQIDHLLYRR